MRRYCLAWVMPPRLTSLIFVRLLFFSYLVTENSLSTIDVPENLKTRDARKRNYILARIRQGVGCRISHSTLRVWHWADNASLAVDLANQPLQGIRLVAQQRIVPLQLLERNDSDVCNLMDHEQHIPLRLI